MVESHVKDSDIKQEIREILKECPDIERSLSRISVGKATPKDLHAINGGLQVAINLSYVLFTLENTKYQSLEGHDQLVETLSNALNNDHANITKNGGFINPDFSLKLAELKYTKKQCYIR